MAAIAFMTQDFAGACNFHAFFQPFMGFHFSHNTTPLFTLILFKQLEKGENVYFKPLKVNKNLLKDKKVLQVLPCLFAGQIFPVSLHWLVFVPVLLSVP
jgi:hypothetical protein